MRSGAVRILITYSSAMLWLLTEPAVRPLAAQAMLDAAAAGGSVRDEQGSPVPDAKITLTDDSKAMTRESSSDSSGAFLFPAVSAGRYTLRAAKPGFSTYQVNDLAIEIGQRVVLDITLRVGEIRTAVTVSAADKAALDEESNVIGTVVDSAQVTSLPLNGRNFLQLGLLDGGSAQVSTTSNLFSTNVGPPSGRLFCRQQCPIRSATRWTACRSGDRETANWL